MATAHGDPNTNPLLHISSKQQQQHISPKLAQPEAPGFPSTDPVGKAKLRLVLSLRMVKTLDSFIYFSLVSGAPSSSAQDVYS